MKKFWNSASYWSKFDVMLHIKYLVLHRIFLFLIRFMWNFNISMIIKRKCQIWWNSFSDLILRCELKQKYAKYEKYDISNIQWECFSVALTCTPNYIYVNGSMPPLISTYIYIGTMDDKILKRLAPELLYLSENKLVYVIIIAIIWFFFF